MSEWNELSDMFICDNLSANQRCKKLRCCIHLNRNGLGKQAMEAKRNQNDLFDIRKIQSESRLFFFFILCIAKRFYVVKHERKKNLWKIKNDMNANTSVYIEQGLGM